MLAVTRVLVSRGWLVAAPLWVVAAGALLGGARMGLVGLATRTDHGAAVLVGLGVLVALWYSIAFFTSRGFWLPAEGAGRWKDVIDRHDLALTLRTSTR